MKRLILIIMLAFTGTIVNSQNCFWGKSAVSGSTDYYGQSIASDAYGNTYVTGAFSYSTMIFGGYTLNNDNSGTDDYYIVKYNSDGTVAWAQRAGGGIHDDGTGIVTDASGYIYVTGYFRSDSIIFGTNVLHNSNPGYSQVFIVKYDSNGNVIWAKTSGGSRTSDDNSTDIVIDDSGNLYISGFFYSSTLAFETSVLTNYHTSGSDVFVAKYDTDGNFIWAKSAGGRSYERCLSETVDANGNVYLTGYFEGDSIKFNNDTLHNPGLYILKFDTNGNELWAREANNGSGSEAHSVATDTNGDLYVAGYYTYDNLITSGDTINNIFSGTKDIFLLKYNSSGNIIWAKGYGGKKDDIANDISIDLNNNVYVIGMFGDTAIFGNDTLINSVPDSYNHNLFIAKYDSNGNVLATWSASGSNNGNKINVNSTNNIYITGYYSSSQMNLENIHLPYLGNESIFIAHTYDFDLVAGAITNNECNGDSTGAATVDLSGGWRPFTYSWDTGSSDSIVTNLTAGNYSVTVTDINGCIQSTGLIVSEPEKDTASICMVTVDSLSQYNIIIWDKTQYTRVDSFIVYREITTDNYLPIAQIDYDAPSQFIDTVRTLYFPNTGNPNEGTYRYKIMLHDTCGKYSELSPYHNTIYFLNNSGSFYWTQPYTIENGANPVANYVLMRDDSSSGDWHDVTSVAGTQQVINDPLYSVYQNIASWRVKTEWSISCTPTLKDISSVYNSSLSNVYTNVHAGVNEYPYLHLMNIYPNPATDKVEISTPGKSQIEIMNIEGQLLRCLIAEEGHTVTDISGFSQGIYFVKVKTGNEVIVKKLIKQ